MDVKHFPHISSVFSSKSALLHASFAKADQQPHLDEMFFKGKITEDKNLDRLF